MKICWSEHIIDKMTFPQAYLPCSFLSETISECFMFIIMIKVVLFDDDNVEDDCKKIADESF